MSAISKFMFIWRRFPGKLLVWAAAIVLGIGGCKMFDSFEGTVMPPNTPATDFTLTDQNGQPFTLSSQKGKVVILFFGYTFCPDVCPTTLAEWRQVEAALTDKKDALKFVYVTVDPERDTPERMKNHLQAFSPDFIGLTGKTDVLEKVYDAYHIFRDKEEVKGKPGMYFMSHTSRMFVIDSRGNLRLSFSYGTPVKVIVHDIRLLLKESS